MMAKYQNRPQYLNIHCNKYFSKILSTHKHSFGWFIKIRVSLAKIDFSNKINFDKIDFDEINLGWNNSDDISLDEIN